MATHMARGSSEGVDFERWRSPETHVRWERGLALVAGMVAVVVTFFVLIALLPLPYDDEEPVTGLQGAVVTAAAAAPQATEQQPTAAPTQAASSSDLKLSATSRQVPNVRRGPSTSAQIVMQLKQGQKVDVVGRSPDMQWLQILNPDAPVMKLWVSADMLDVTGDPRTLPEVKPE